MNQDRGSHGAHASVHGNHSFGSVAASGTGQNIHHHPSNVSLHAEGGNGAHNNMPPFLVVNFIICLSGIYPSRN